jgi:hypothetical protein
VIIVFLGSSPGLFSEDLELEYVSSILWTQLHDIEINGNYVYCAFLNGLMILDVSNKRKPIQVSQLFLGGGFGLALKDKLAFVAAGRKGLKVVDVSDPRKPVLKGAYDTPGKSESVAVEGRYAFMADGEAGLQILDIQDPSRPALTGSYDTPGWANDLALKGKHAFVADGKAGLQVIDIGNPSNP